MTTVITLPTVDVVVPVGKVYYPEAHVFLTVVFEGPDPRPVVFPVVPKSVSVFSNSYKEADTFQVTFDAKDLPFSPEIIRSAACEVRLYSKRNLTDRLVTVAKGSENPGDLAGDHINPTIVGLVDSAEMEWGEDGRTFSVDGRDYTALFIDKPWNAKKRVVPGRRLDVTLQALMDEVPGTHKGGSSVMRLFTPDPKTMPVVGKGFGRTAKKGITAPKNANYWEVMTSLAISHGYILFVQGLDVILTTPRTFVAGKTKYRKVAWGRNLTKLQYKRKIGKERAPVVEIISYDQRNRRPLKAQFPDTKAEDKRADLNAIGVDRKEVRQFVLDFPVHDQAQLNSVAEMTFLALARAELTVQIETMDLTDLEGDDLIELRSGDPLSVRFDPFNESLIKEFTTKGERFGYLTQRCGFSAQVANLVVENLGLMEELREPMRVREATLDWTADGGLRISAELVQFVNVASHKGATP